MNLIKRKTAECGSILYRFFIWPFVRCFIEIKTKSIMKPGSYIKGTRLSGRNLIGKDAFMKNCAMGYGSYVQSGCDLTDTDIGSYTSLGSNVKTIIGSHPTEKLVALHPAFNVTNAVGGFTYVKKDRFRDMPEHRTKIGSDVWLGDDVRIMGGVKIGDGAVVGTGALVIKDVPPFSVNVGVPAKTIKYRFSGSQIERLLSRKWWEKDEKWIRDNIESFGDIEDFLR